MAGDRLARVPRRVAALALWSIAALTVACGDKIDPSDPTVLDIVNNGEVAIDSVNYSGCEAAEFGENRLAPSETVAPGASRAFEIDPGCYDLRVWFGEDPEVRFEEEIEEGETFTWEVEP
jgi:hypothetical protein